MNAAQWTPMRARLLAGIAVIALACWSAHPAPAQAAADDVLVQNFPKELEERDAAIPNLVKRVQQLEQRIGAAGPAPGDQTTALAAAAPAVAAASSPQTAQAEAPAEIAPPAAPRDAAPGTFALDPEDAERALERTLAQVGALLLPLGAIDVEPGFTYQRREMTRPFLFQSEGLLQVGTLETRENELTGSLDFRFGLPWTSQLEFGVPYRYRDVSEVFLSTEESTSASGFGDVNVGFAKEFLRERGWRPDLIGRVTWNSNTGQEKNGLVLGSGFHSVTGSLTALKRQDPLAFIASGFYRTNFEKNDIDPGDEFGFILGTVLAASPDTSLSLSLQQTFANDVSLGGRSIPGSDQVSSVLVVGASSVLGRGVLLSLNAGVGLTNDAPDYFIGLSLPIRFNLPIW